MRRSAGGSQQTQATTAGNQQTQATTAGTEQTQATTAGTEQTQATTAGTEQTQATTAGTEQTQATTAGTEQTQATTAGTEQTQATASGSRRSDGQPIGVLALQGGFAAHATLLGGLGVAVREVRVPADLVGLAGLVLPGGESTTMMLGIAREGLADPLRAFAADGKPILATCAGLIILDRDHLGLLDVRCVRNAFGRQVRSFETDLDLAGFDAPVRAVFIRAPWIVEHGPGVETLGAVDGHVVAVEERRILATAFHPELAGETQLHAWLLAEAGLRPPERS